MLVWIPVARVSDAKWMFVDKFWRQPKTSCSQMGINPTSQVPPIGSSAIERIAVLLPSLNHSRQPVSALDVGGRTEEHHHFKVCIFPRGLLVCAAIFAAVVVVRNLYVLQSTEHETYFIVRLSAIAHDNCLMRMAGWMFVVCAYKTQGEVQVVVTSDERIHIDDCCPHAG